MLHAPAPGAESDSMVPGVSPAIYSAEDFRRIADLIHTETGIVLSERKQMLAYSRLAPLVRRSGLTSFGAFLETLGSDPQAMTEVIAALTTTKGGFWYAAAIAGLCMGSSQSSGRAMAGMLAPPRQLAEFYGLWTFATRLASIIGPLSYGAITWVTGGNQRLAIGFTALLFLLGLVLLLPVNMERGRRAALSGPGAANG